MYIIKKARQFFHVLHSQSQVKPQSCKYLFKHFLGSDFRGAVTQQTIDKNVVVTTENLGNVEDPKIFEVFFKDPLYIFLALSKN